MILEILLENLGLKKEKINIIITSSESIEFNSSTTQGCLMAWWLLVEYYISCCLK